MAEAYAHMKPNPRIVSFASQRLKELETVIENSQNEANMWKQILGKIPTCEKCGGRGDIKHYPYGMEDGPRFKKCEKCEGTGSAS